MVLESTLASMKRGTLVAPVLIIVRIEIKFLLCGYGLFIP